MNHEETWGAKDHKPQSRDAAVAYTSVVTTAPGFVGDELFVTIADATGGFHETGPCYWTANGVALPSLGSIALVIFDNNNSPWVVSWQ